MSKKPKKKTKKPESSLKPRRIKIKVIGLGGGGSAIVSEMAQDLSGVSFLIADTDARVFKKNYAPRKRNLRVFQFGQEMLSGMGTGMNPEIGRRAAEAEKEKIAKIFQGQDLAILIASLGGGVASGAGPIFAEVARAQKNISLGIFTLPFNFEGEKKMRIAQAALKKFQENLSGTICVPNEKIFQIIDKKTPLKKALSSLNQVFFAWLRDLIEVISKPNLINIDFADLKTILKERGEKIFFSQVTAQGANRVEEVVKKLFQNPLFEGPPKNVKRILFNITGGPDLGLKEVESVSEAIAKLNPRAKIIFGISQSPKYKGKIKIILIAVSPVPLKAGLKGGLKGGLKLPVKKKKEKLAKKPSSSAKKEKSRRSALEVKKAKEEAEEKEWEKEPSWEIPAFLRRRK